MIYFCADDYGVSPKSNTRIETCIETGVLNKVSVLPNGDIKDFKHRLSDKNAEVSLHINLVEGHCLADAKEVSLLASEDGIFRHTFVGLFFLSVSNKRKELEKQLYKEISAQIKLWTEYMGKDAGLWIDSHQHTHMIPLIFKTLLRVIEDEGVNVEYMRIPSEPVMPYILTPSLYLQYSLSGLVKQWLLKFLALVNRGRFKRSKINTALFMGMVFSGRLAEKPVRKLLKKYLKIAEKKKKDIEIAFHPGYLEEGEQPFEGMGRDFNKFYYSKNRKMEFDTLINLKKEG